MKFLHEHTVTRILFRTVVDLRFSSGVAFLFLVFILVALSLNRKNSFALLFFVMGLGAFVGGTLWAKPLFTKSAEEPVFGGQVNWGENGR